MHQKYGLNLYICHIKTLSTELFHLNHLIINGWITAFLATGSGKKRRHIEMALINQGSKRTMAIN